MDAKDVALIVKFFTSGKKKFADHDARLMKAYRAYLGMSLSDVAQKSGVSRETVSSAERGMRKTYNVTRKAIIEAYFNEVEEDRSTD